MEFESFAKIARLSRECTITEKIDGTNAQIVVEALDSIMPEPGATWQSGTTAIFVGSRNRWITPTDDNFGFARWVADHGEELVAGLGFGRHFGEWWGAGIGRRYGLQEKRFSLFNVGKWTEETKPACCHVVPTLYNGIFDSGIVAEKLADLRMGGSTAAPGFMNPEGVIIYHHAANLYFKKTLDKDDEWKGKGA